MSFCFKNTSTDVVTFLRRRRKIPTGQKFSSSVEKDSALRAEQNIITSQKILKPSRKIQTNAKVRISNF